MQIIELAIKILAIWGAGLSTVLGISKLLESRKRIKIYVERVYFRGITQITIINTGRRRFTIADINVGIGHRQDGDIFWEGVPANAIFGERGEEFPITIEPDDYFQRQISDVIERYISDVIERYISDKDTEVKIEVIDITGKKFTKYRKRVHDIKWGNIDEGGW